jgi:preprotein translocase subunit YajC
MYWYFTPLAIGISLFFLGSIRDTKELITKFTILIVMGVIVYFLNKRAVKKQIAPRLKKIDELIKVMEE